MMSPHTIMIVDDNTDMLAIYSRVLAQEGYAVSAAATGTDCLQQISTVCPDIFLMDVILPDWNGIDLVREIKRRPEFANSMFVLMSGFQSDSESKIQGLDAGAVDFIARPVPNKELVAKVKSLVKVMDFQDSLVTLSNELDHRVAERTKDLEATIEALRKSEDTQRSILATAMDGFWLADTDGWLLDVNETYCRMSGYSRQELLNMRISDLDSVESEQDTDGRIKMIIDRGEGRFESQHRRKNGSILDVEVSVQFRPTEGGRLVVFLHDISTRERDLNQLKDLTRRLLLATSSAGLGVWDWNVRENSMVWDNRMFELYGITPETFPKTVDAWMDGLHPEDRGTALAVCQSALNGERDFDTEFRVCHPDGTVRHIKGNALVIRTPDGTAERMIGINADITAAREAEKTKSQLESKLQQAQKMESVGRLAGGIAHDFNNILTVIQGYSELGIMKADPTSEVYGFIGEIRKAAERSADLTRQLLAFARKQCIAPQVLDLNETVAGMLKMLQRLIGEDIHLHWQAEADLWYVKIDPSQIDQILANLSVNARDAIVDVGTVTIEAGNCTLDPEYCAGHIGSEPGDYVRLAVTDNGHGINQETLPNIFEPFFTTKPVGEGTGLGLATVYGIVRQNGGSIDVCSEPGSGTTFSIYLPRYVGQAEQPRTARTVETLPVGQETVLVVDDEPEILNVTQKILAQQGYVVLHASTPGEAIRLADEYSGEIHLLLTDVVMPEMNGFDLAGKLQVLYPRIKSLFMSGYTSDVISRHGTLNVGVPFIQKPFSVSGLTVKIREVLDGRYPSIGATPP